MEQNTKAYEQVRTLTDLLNQYRHEYYNLSAPSVSDQEYDRLFDALAALEKETGIVMSNSPTQTVGYPSVSELPKTTHAIPLLSMDKVKSEEEMLSFVGDKLVLIMLKLDGLMGRSSAPTPLPWTRNRFSRPSWPPSTPSCWTGTPWPGSSLPSWSGSLLRCWGRA